MRSTISSNLTCLEARNLSLTFIDRSLAAPSWRDLFIDLTRLRGHRRTPQFEALQEISFAANDGERIAILGKNGSGKSTLGGCLAGAYAPQGGELHIGGTVRVIADLSLGIYPELSGRENAQILAQLLYPAEIRRDHLIEEALDFSELGADLNRPYRFYSQGMKARLYLSIASARAPDILIFDEAFDGTDFFFQKKVHARLMKMIEAARVTVMVSHSFDQLRAVCRRGLLLEQGRLLADGPLEQVIRTYTGTPA